MDYKATIKADGRHAVRVEGYGVIFDSVDLEGDTFTRDTDLWLDYVSTVPLLWEHAMDEVMGRRVLGTVKRSDMRVDDFGLWVSAQLDTSQEYVRAVLELVKRGVVGWSSGAVSHLVERADNARNGVIKSWMIAELSLTTRPAEPRTIGASIAKTLGAASLWPNLGVMAEAKTLGEALKHIQERDRLRDEIDKMQLELEIAALERSL